MKEKLVDKMLDILADKLNISLQKGDYAHNRLLLRGVLNSLMPTDLGEDFFDLERRLLHSEALERGIVDVDKFVYTNKIAHFNGDILKLNADAIVNAANDNFLGCFVPLHNCIDNVIMSAAGFEMRNELQKLKSSPDYDSQFVKVTKGYALPCKYVFHTAGPIIYDKVEPLHIAHLQKCYEACLIKAENLRLKTIAFCCISTGEFRFPADLACKIAVRTVKNWLLTNNSDLKVIFNTFTQRDKLLYEQELFAQN